MLSRVKSEDHSSPPPPPININPAWNDDPDDFDAILPSPSKPSPMPRKKVKQSNAPATTTSSISTSSTSNRLAPPAQTHTVLTTSSSHLPPQTPKPKALPRRTGSNTSVTSSSHHDQPLDKIAARAAPLVDHKDDVASGSGSRSAPSSLSSQPQPNSQSRSSQSQERRKLGPLALSSSSSFAAALSLVKSASSQLRQPEQQQQQLSSSRPATPSTTLGTRPPSSRKRKHDATSSWWQLPGSKSAIAAAGGGDGSGVGDEDIRNESGRRKSAGSGRGERGKVREANVEEEANEGEHESDAAEDEDGEYHPESNDEDGAGRGIMDRRMFEELEIDPHLGEKGGVVHDDQEHEEVAAAHIEQEEGVHEKAEREQHLQDEEEDEEDPAHRQHHSSLPSPKSLPPAHQRAHLLPVPRQSGPAWLTKTNPAQMANNKPTSNTATSSSFLHNNVKPRPLTQRLTPPSPVPIPARALATPSTSHLSQSSQSPPLPSSSTVQIPDVYAFLSSLPLPSLSRLAPTFNSLGCSSSIDLLGLADTSEIGLRARKTLLDWIGEEVEGGMSRWERLVLEEGLRVLGEALKENTRGEQ